MGALKVQVWIYRRVANQIQFLILKTTQERGAFWQPVTGGVERGEKIGDGAKREADEETSLRFKSSPVSLDHPFTFERRGKKIEEHAFMVEAVEGQEPKLDSHEHVEYQWVNLKEALEMIRFDSNREVLRIAAEKLGI